MKTKKVNILLSIIFFLLTASYSSYGYADGLLDKYITIDEGSGKKILVIKDTGLTLELIAEIANALGSDELIEVRFDNVRLTREAEGGFELLLQGLQKNRSVVRFGFMNSRLNPVVASLIEAMLNNQALRVLNLAGNNIYTDAARAIAVFLQNHALEELNLENNDIDADGAIAIFNVVRDHRHLLRLNLGRNQIGIENKLANRTGPSACLVIANALRVNRTLVALDLRSNGIGGEISLAHGPASARNMQTIIEALQGNRTLTMLHLGNDPACDDCQLINSIDEEAARALYGVLVNNTALYTLTLPPCVFCEPYVNLVLERNILVAALAPRIDKLTQFNMSLVMHPGCGVGSGFNCLAPNAAEIDYLALIIRTPNEQLMAGGILNDGDLGSILRVRALQLQIEALQPAAQEVRGTVVLDVGVPNFNFVSPFSYFSSCNQPH